MTSNKDNARSAERLTGKQRVLRGLKYSAIALAVDFVFWMLLYLCLAKGEPEGWQWGLVSWLVHGLPTAVLAGGIVMLFPVRRLWQGIFAVVVAVLATGVL